jgi:hypothetical protein
MRSHISSHIFFRLLCAFLSVDGTKYTHQAITERQRCAHNRSFHETGGHVLIPGRAVIESDGPLQSSLPFRQAIEAGKCVRKGKHCVTVVYADRFPPDGISWFGPGRSGPGIG